ncbi:class-II aminoacyl-tRNA synthetase family protein [Inquilinus limosus]|uniref:hypothetical protein n=1 Tax=Inquilinus limosus TaxID=171674 RepID=UPI0006895BDB|nr:hypothetical protein [Inquilinus limosus]
MTQTKTTAVTPTRAEDYAGWYQAVVRAADLAEPAPVRGCMTIKPWGYGIWERIQAILDRRFKETGHRNCYFPLFIPLQYLQAEAEHVEGFAAEVAMVTAWPMSAAGCGSTRRWRSPWSSAPPPRPSSARRSRAGSGRIATCPC